ncbi:MAG TPA: flagellar export protein FliJ [Spirochaetota bacterium]|nr:flagellar export protein FliJ [Spirochaetota bacterium]HRZ26526.1 flagellar export protein FliJ [Spirochaetota bacterium]HSA13921.1 flagellar export protein FliJ [Spirochaetota bacterium]
MKKFKFGLQKLLELREAREREVKNELAKIVSIQNRERVKQESLRKSIADNQRMLAEKMRTGKLRSEEAILFEKYFHVSSRAIDVAGEKIKSMEPEVNRIREKLAAASKERKTVEKLKERKMAEYNYKINRETAKENDDINQNVFNRQSLQEL